MLLKKCALIGSTLAILGLPVLASANLLTYNYTNEISTVKITSSILKLCSVGPLSNKFTPAIKNGIPGNSSTTPAEVKTICQQFSGTCEADMYATPNCDAGGAKPIAHLKIDVGNLAVAIVSKLSPKYAIDVAGSTVVVKYAG